MRVMPLLHSLRYEPNFREWPRLAVPNAKTGVVEDRQDLPGNVDSRSRGDVAGASSAAAAVSIGTVATGVSGLGARLGDGFDHLRSAGELLMQKLVGVATVRTSTKKPSTECDLDTVHTDTS